MAWTLSTYISSSRDFSGLDLTADEVRSLANDGRRKLLCDSDYRRANVECGPSVAGQELYAAPDAYRFLKLKVNGVPAYRTNAEQVDVFKTESGSFFSLPRGASWYYLTVDELASESVGLYPTPSVNGAPITALIVARPPDLVEESDEETAVPPEFRRYVLDYIKAATMGAQEDDQDDESFYRDRFDRGVEELRRLRNSKTGRGPRQFSVKGFQWSA